MATDRRWGVFNKASLPLFPSYQTFPKECYRTLRVAKAFLRECVR